MIYGYARVSDRSQQIFYQTEELQKYGCDEIVEEVITGIAKEKKLNELVDSLQEGDSLVVTRVDRLGRKTVQLLQLIDKINKKGANLIIIGLGLDTRTPIGQGVIGILSAISQMERDMLKEKQKKGIKSAKLRGVHLGRKGNFTKEGLALAVEMYKSDNYTVSEIEAATQVSRGTLYRALQKENNDN